ncbi:hypothetical protein JAAARDRAFT_198507 [Jaapia argillacea MUCL 33604]|uniref:F-box domain-containing protein n=1 Tax=Jaapia argillacea MUCL 33604 TaxID=933084 RepID=A0A067PE21_9AGAM|nr:hypothetical protein JAAARDRAFT_198507 [Jaapia argillacea MUCL 33604]
MGPSSGIGWGFWVQVGGLQVVNSSDWKEDEDPFAPMLEYEDVTDVEESSDEEGIEVSKSPVTVAPALADEPPSKRLKNETIPEFQGSEVGNSGVSIVSISADILTRICGYCSPSDLVNIARVNKGLRTILVSQKFSSSLDRLIYSLVDFASAVGKRALEGSTFISSDNSVMSEDLDDSDDSEDGPNTRELLPTFVLSAAPSFDYECFWRPDVNVISKRLKSLKDDVKAEKPDARRLLDEFVSTRKTQVQLIQRDAAAYEKWADEREKCRKSSLAKLTKARLSQIESRLVDLGWSESDIHTIRAVPEASRSILLTDQTWERIRPKLEAYLAEDKRKKLEEAQIKQVEARLDIFLEGFKKFKDAVHLTQHVLLPSESQASYLEEFYSLIHADVDIDITSESFSKSFNDLPSIVASWASIRETAILGRLPDTLRRSYVDKGLKMFFGLSVWVKEAMGEICHRMAFDSGNGKTTLRFRARASEAVAALSRVLGLNPETVLVLDLDRFDGRFLCKGCPTNAKVKTGRQEIAYTWRQAVKHYVEEPSHVPPTWETITLDYIPKFDRFGTTHNQNAWICSHRTTCLIDATTREDLIGHCRAFHQIPTPEEGRDFFFNPVWIRALGMTSSVRFDADGVPINLSKTYKCIHCDPQSKRGKREFSGPGVESHLKAVHTILAAVQGRDYA